jgi:hypothetical protein
MLVLEGAKIYDKGVLVKTLELAEGQKSDRFVICENLRFGSLREVKGGSAPMHITEAAKGRKVLLTLEGVFQRSDTVNANNRIYPDSIWKKSIDEDGGAFRKRLSAGEVLSESDHPKDGETLLTRVAGVVEDIWRDENDRKVIRGRIHVLDTTSGRNLLAIHQGGGHLGVSSRGQGSVVRLDGKDVVQEDFALDTWDLVHNPSTPGAYPNEVEESMTPVTRRSWGRAPKLVLTETQQSSSSTSILERVSTLSVQPGATIPEAISSIRRAYREAYHVDGPLSEEESNALSLFVQSRLDGNQKTGVGPVVARISVRSGPLCETVATIEIRAGSVPELRKKLDERLGKVRGVVEVEIDRSEEVYEECTQRFATLLNAQSKTLTEQTAKVSEAEKTIESLRGASTEMSSRLAVAKTLITQFAERVKTAETASKDLSLTEQAAENLVEALSVEFREEGLRAAIAAIAATHPGLPRLVEELSQANSLTEAIAITKRLKNARSGLIEREPTGLRDARCDEALTLSLREGEAQVLANTKEKRLAPELQATKQIVETLQERGFK